MELSDLAQEGGITMPWAHLEESYNWLTWEDPDPEHLAHLAKVFPEQHAEIPQELWDKLRAAEKALDAVQDEVDAYRGTRE